MNELNLTTPSLLFSAISLILLAYTNRFLSYASVVRTLNERYQANPDKDPTTLNQIRNFVLRLRLIRAMQTFGAVSLILCLVSMFLFSIRQNLFGEIVFGAGMISLAISLVLCVWEIQISTEAISLHLQNIRRRQREQDTFLGSSLRRNANRREGETLGEHNNRKNREKQQREKLERDATKFQDHEQTKVKETPNDRSRRERLERNVRQEQEEEKNVSQSDSSKSVRQERQEQNRSKFTKQEKAENRRVHREEHKKEGETWNLASQESKKQENRGQERRFEQKKQPRNQTVLPTQSQVIESVNKVNTVNPESKAISEQKFEKDAQALQQKTVGEDLSKKVAEVQQERSEIGIPKIEPKIEQVETTNLKVVSQQNPLEEIHRERKIFANRRAKANEQHPEALVEKTPSRYQLRRERKIESN